MLKVSVLRILLANLWRQEEATRVVLMMAFPGRIPANRVVSIPVSHMDVTSTVLDYLGYSHLDHSDGTSLRRYVDRRSYNENFDERVVVSEIDSQIPKSPTTFRGSLGDIPNLSIRKGGYKLIVTKSSKSDVLDMMYDLSQDPYVSS
jgi:arylsulfatase A-like enzyme